MRHHVVRAIIALSNFGYIAACLILYLIAIIILVSSVWIIIADLLSTKAFSVYDLLDEVGLIVFSIAVIDIGKYLMLESVMKERGQELLPHESQKSFIKFAFIIASALSLEGFVLTIEVAKHDMTKIIYPALVLLSATLYVIGIGIYQRCHCTIKRVQ